MPLIAGLQLDCRIADHSCLSSASSQSSIHFRILPAGLLLHEHNCCLLQVSGQARHPLVFTIPGLLALMPLLELRHLQKGTLELYWKHDPSELLWKKENSPGMWRSTLGFITQFSLVSQAAFFYWPLFGSSAVILHCHFNGSENNETRSAKCSFSKPHSMSFTELR